MSRDFTVFQFDVHEDAVRRVLSSIPGVTPLPPDEQRPSDERSESSDAATGAATDAETGTSTDAEKEISTGDAGEADSAGATTEPIDESHAGTPGAEAHLSDSAAETQSGATMWTRPSTPWPGAPGEAEEEKSGLLERLRSKRALLVGGVVTVLGVVGAAAVWFLKFRGDGGSDQSDERGRRSTGRAGETAAAESRRDATEREPHAEDSDSRSYPVDAAPIIGMAFLAVAAIVLRRVQSGREA